MNKFLAMSLVLVMAGSLAACNQANRGELGANRTTMDQELASGQSEVRGRAASLEDMEEGHTLDYYLSQFEQQGYDVADVQRQGNGWLYDLRRNNGQERFLVTLQKDENSNQINDINVDKLERIDISQNQDAKQLANRLSQLKAGKQPAEYFTELSHVGTITDYKLNDDSAKITILSDMGTTSRANQAEVREAAKDRDLEFHVNMDVDPATNKVVVIKVDQDAWGFGNN